LIQDLPEIFLHGTFLGLLISVLNLAEIILHDLNTVSLVLIRSLVALNLVFSILNACLKFLLLIVELIFECQEMLIQRNTITEKRFIATCLVFLVHLLVFEKLDRCLHGGDLLVQVKDDIIVDFSLLTNHLPTSRQLLNFVSGLGKVGVTFEFLINDGASGSLIDIIVGRGKLDVACGGSTATTS